MPRGIYQRNADLTQFKKLQEQLREERDRLALRLADINRVLDEPQVLCTEPQVLCTGQSPEWLREKVAIEDESLVSVGGLVSKISTPRRRPMSPAARAKIGAAKKAP